MVGVPYLWLLSTKLLVSNILDILWWIMAWILNCSYNSNKLKFMQYRHSFPGGPGRLSRFLYYITIYLYSIIFPSQIHLNFPLAHKFYCVNIGVGIAHTLNHSCTAPRSPDPAECGKSSQGLSRILSRCLSLSWTSHPSLWLPNPLTLPYLISRFLELPCFLISFYLIIRIRISCEHL